MRAERGPQNEVLAIGEPAADRPVFVFLHEGLGSVSLWRNFPDTLCRHCAVDGLLYSRTGYGRSPPFDAPLPPDFMHRAARDELPGVLAHWHINRPVLVGHSDGASIALIYAAAAASAGWPPPLAVVAMAPHLFVERICTRSIGALARNYDSNDKLRAAMNRHHANGDLTFQRWTQAWLSEAFACWDIRPVIDDIDCPVLAIQGEQDQYGTLEHINLLARLGPQTRTLVLSDCGHSPHVDQPNAVSDAIAQFFSGLNL